MRVLIVQPDIMRASASQGLFPCVAGNLLATILNLHGHRTDVLDPLMKVLRFPADGATSEEVVARLIEQERVGVVGISTVLQTRWKAIETARAVKTRRPETRVILGGPGASLLAPQILGSFPDLFDCVAIGEGEHTALDFVNAVEGGTAYSRIAGVALIESMASRAVVFTSPREPISDLDEVPFPDYSAYLDLLPERRFNTASVLTYRGCPYDCEYCGSTAMKRGVRFRSPANVVKEIEYLCNSCGVQNLRIGDDAFGLNRPCTEEILERIVGSGLRVNMYAHSRVDIVDSELLSLFKRAGGREMYYGVESGSPRIRELMRKNPSNEMILDACAATKREEIDLGLFLMFGYPTETLDDIRQTYRLVERIDPDDVACAVTKIQPGTRLYERALTERVITDEIWMNDKREYFTFLTEEQLEFARGCEILFYERFVKKSIRSTFEKNSDLIDVAGDPSRVRLLQDRAARELAL